MDFNSYVFTSEKGKPFVAGLFWHPISGSKAEIFKETKRLAEEVNADLAVFRNTQTVQVGLTSSGSGGVKKGVYAAAAMISKSIEDVYSQMDFLCATKISDDKWIYVAQRHGVIMPKGDVVGSEDEVKMLMLSDMSSGTWPLVIAPAAWAVDHNAKEMSFAEFLPNKAGKVEFKKWWALQPVDQISSSFMSFKNLMKLVLIASLLGYGGYYVQMKRAAAKAAELARQAELDAAQNQANAPVKPPHPWKSQPVPAVLAKTCMETMSKVDSLWPGNWKIQDITCADGNLTVVWKREPNGWVKHLLEVQPNAVVSTDGNLASLTIPFNVVNESPDEAVDAENQRTLAMYSAVQPYGITITLTPPAVITPLPGQQPAPDGQPIQDWREMKWEAKNLTLPPEVVLSSLAGNGFRLSKMQATFVSGQFTWNMEGTQYVAP